MAPDKSADITRRADALVYTKHHCTMFAFVSSILGLPICLTNQCITQLCRRVAGVDIQIGRLSYVPLLSNRGLGIRD